MSAILAHKNLTALPRLKRRMSDIRVLSGKEAPAPMLDEFYERMFPARSGFLKQHWRWLYRTDNDTAVKSPIVAIKDGQVAGHVGIIPLTLRRAGDQRTAAWVCDIAVLPEHRGKAVGAVLLAEAMAVCPLRIGFPNDLSWRLISKFGWKGQMNTFGLSLLLRPDRHPKLSESSGNKPGVKTLATLAGLATRIVWRARTLATGLLSALPATTDQLAMFQERQSPATLHVARSQEFLNWRISAHPDVEEHFVLKTADGRASAIARVVADGNCHRLHLLTLKTDPFDPQRLSDFLAGVVRWALGQNVDVISTVTSDPVAARVIRWWLPVLKPLRFASHADNLSGEEFLNSPGHIWEYLDGDFDLTYTSSNDKQFFRSLQCA